MKKALAITPKLCNILWESTLTCNAKCKHCGSDAKGKEYEDELTTEEAKNVFKEIASKYNPKEIYVTLTGGEPLLRKDIFEVMRYLYDLKFRVGMTTNGILINDDIAKKMKDNGLTSISISIDGLEKNHDEFRGVPGSFNKIIKNIEILKKYDFLHYITITTVVSKSNIWDLEGLYEVVRKLKVDSWRIVNVEPIGRAKDNDELTLDNKDYKFLFDFIKEKRKNSDFDVTYGCSHYLGMEYELEERVYPFFCMAGYTTCSILYNGDIYVCTSVERRQELVQGNVRKDSFVDVWENEFKWVRDVKKLENPKCKNCKEWKYCLGDSLHSWDFENKQPLICMNDILKKK